MCNPGIGSFAITVLYELIGYLWMHNIPLKGQEESLSRRSIGAGIEEICPMHV